MEKRCGKCGEAKDVEAFQKRKASRDGREGTCKKCRTEGKRKWYAENRDKYRKTNKAWADKNREYLYKKRRQWGEENEERLIKYREANRERFVKAARQWQRDNASRHAANVSRRRSAKIMRTPNWLTEEHLAEIEGFYHEAREVTAKTGVKHVVDHIVPLLGETVCGLHVPWNLQVITFSRNCRKGNRLELQDGMW